MKSWEFLIQKKDNPAWLSLKTQKLKLEAGEYRLVARSHRPNIDVEVRVTYQPLEEPRPQPRSQKRNARTNAEGLLAIVPFINFQPGLWQISCSCDLMSELLGEPWQEVVRLHVLPSTATAEATAVLETPPSEAAAPEPPAVTEDSPRQPNAIATETDPPRLDAIAPAPPSAADAEIDPEEAAAIESLLDRSIQNLEQILASAGHTDEPPAAPEPAPLPASALADALEKLQLRLTLYHENFVRHQGESLLISGQVDAIDPERNDLQPFLAPLGGQPVRLLLRFLLRDPQTSAPAASQVEEDARIQTLFDSQDPSASTALPKIFGYRLEVPQEYRNPLILGEAILEIVVGSENSPSQEEMEKIVARSSFTIAAAVEELLEAAFTPPLETENRSPALPEIREPEPAPPPQKAELPDLSEPSEPPTSAPASPQILPPKLSPSASPKPARSLKLPEFPSDLAPQPAEETSAPEPDGSAEASIDFPSDELPEPETEPSAVSPESHQLQTADETFLSTELEDLWAEPEEGNAEEEDAEEELPPEPDQLDRAFQSLHLEDRFWSRMNSLVEDAPFFAAEQPSPEETDLSPAAETPPPAETGEVFETIPSVPEPSAVDVPLEKLFTDSAPIEDPLLVKPMPMSPSSTAAIPLETQPAASDWADDEIVVDDGEAVEWAEPGRDTSGLPYPSDRPVSPEVPQNPREQLARAATPVPPGARSDSNEPIPTPLLEVTEGELVAGEAAFVRVKLPSGSDSVYVKLWVLDCQTRSLLDGPRALLDLSANSEGELEATTQMSVPLGSLEIRFEAIAIDIDTQRESHKASISRAVIPPNLPNTLYNEF